MKKFNGIKSVALIIILNATGCGGGSDSDDKLVTYQFDLNESDQGWQAGFADYPPADKNAYELTSSWVTLPTPLANKKGFNVSGDNHSADLFMFITRKLTGLKSSTRYEITFSVQFATNAPSNCVGVGGPPGESVTIKAGATSFEPKANQIDDMGFVRMNIDYGIQASGGSNAVVIGNFANSQTDCLNGVYELKNLSNSDIMFTEFSDSEGAIWAIFGTDSGFEATTSIFYTSIEIQLREL